MRERDEHERAIGDIASATRYSVHRGWCRLGSDTCKADEHWNFKCVSVANTSAPSETSPPQPDTECIADGAACMPGGVLGWCCSGSDNCKADEHWNFKCVSAENTSAPSETSPPQPDTQCLADGAACMPGGVLGWCCSGSDNCKADEHWNFKCVSATNTSAPSETSPPQPDTQCIADGAVCLPGGVLGWCCSGSNHCKSDEHWNFKCVSAANTSASSPVNTIPTADSPPAGEGSLPASRSRNLRGNSKA